MAKKDSKDPFSSVTAYLRAITVAGGIASATLPLAVHSMIEISLKDLSSVNMVLNENLQPVTLPEIVVTGELINSKYVEAGIIPHNQAAEPVSADPVNINNDQDEKNALTTEMAINENLMPVTTTGEAPEVVDEPEATVDVFPVGYGSFRIVIESESEGSYAAMLFDALSNEIISENYDVYKGVNTFILESGSIPQGEYLLRVTNGRVVSEKRVRLK